MEPVLSVLMITYNHEMFVAQALDSILMQQTNFEFEIVIGEDCSTDNTREILLDYRARYPEKINLILQENNIGMLNNFRDTLSACKGEYIAILEGDDYWTDPYKLQKQVDFLESNPDYGMVHTNYAIFDVKANVITSSIRSIPVGNIYHELFLDSYIGTLTVMARTELVREAIKEVSLANQKWLMGDKPIWLYIAHKSLIGYIDYVTATYRMGIESASHTQDVFKKIAFLQSTNEIKLWFVKNYGLDENIYKKIMALHFRAILKIYSQNGYFYKSLITIKQMKKLNVCINLRDYIIIVFSIINDKNGRIYRYYKKLKIRAL